MQVIIPAKQLSDWKKDSKGSTKLLKINAQHNHIENTMKGGIKKKLKKQRQESNI